MGGSHAVMFINGLRVVLGKKSPTQIQRDGNTRTIVKGSDKILGPFSPVSLGTLDVPGQDKQNPKM